MITKANSLGKNLIKIRIEYPTELYKLQVSLQTRSYAIKISVILLRCMFDQSIWIKLEYGLLWSQLMR
jgi:hypothetical protein